MMFSSESLKNCFRSQIGQTGTVISVKLFCAIISAEKLDVRISYRKCFVPLPVITVPEISLSFRVRQ